MKKILFLVFIGTTLVSCVKKDEIVAPAADYADILTNIGTEVIVPTYADLYNKTETLITTVNALKITPNATNLATAQQAWRDARVPWELSEGFLFGPVKQKGLDPSIDSWPVNQTDLDNVLGSSATLTKAYIDGLDGTLKGFHTVEYLLFGANSNKTIADFTPRQLEYLTACTESLAGATKELYYSWKLEKDNFVTNFTSAGNRDKSNYIGQKAALQDVVNGMVTIADEVANGKIDAPYSQQNLTLEESRFSANSKPDFANNIRSIKNAYYGRYWNTSGLGISKIIAAKNSSLDAKVKKEIDEAVSAIENITGTFTYAVINARPSVQAAQIKVRTLQQTLEAEVLPIISNM